MDRFLEALVREEQGVLRVLSPGVGLWSDHPAPGTHLRPGQRIGELQVLNRRYALVLPEGAAGTLAGDLPVDRRVAVEHAQELFRLEADSAGDEVSPKPGRVVSREGLDGGWAIVSPIDGVFYRRHSPDLPPFVEVGSRVRTGQAVGLVEAMKTFNEIVYGGPGFPESGEIAEIRCKDASEVHTGQVLMVVR